MSPLGSQAVESPTTTPEKRKGDSPTTCVADSPMSFTADSSESWSPPNVSVPSVLLQPRISDRRFDEDSSSDGVESEDRSTDDPCRTMTPEPAPSSPLSWMCSDAMTLLGEDASDENMAALYMCSNPLFSEEDVLELATARDGRDDEGHEVTFSEMRDAYSKGLLPYFTAIMSPASPTPPQTPPQNCPWTKRWNGYLPLEPMPRIPTEPPVVWQRRRRPRQDMGRLLMAASSTNDPTTPPPSPLSHSTFPTTLTGHDVEILIHLNDGEAGEGKKNSEKLRKAPVAHDSLSIPASQAAALMKNKELRAAKQQQHTPTQTKHEAEAPAAAAEAGERTSAGSASGVEQVHVEPRGSPPSALKELPPLRDASPAKKEELFIQKLQLCGVIFSFDDPTSDKRGKDMKRQTLLELVDYVNTPAGQKIFTESVMGDLMAMVSANVCRALPPATDDFDPEEDEPVLEPAWPHLQVAYEFFLRFIVSSEVNAKAAKKYVDQKFCLQLVELFDSEDPRERDYLKTILHRIYGKFMSHRSFIRRAISNVFYRFVYETERHNGIGELLEILGSIINGFAIPLKKEHLQFLVRALIPLHKPKCVALYHQQLSYCIIQYVEKDADTATPILEGFFKCWPWSCSGKQVMFLNELEEILELLGADQLAQISNTLFTNLARCLDSDHFQVVERALFLWNNEHLVNSGCLSRLNAQTVLPIIYGPLYKNSSGHWNATVEGLAQNVLKMYMEYDLVLYDKCTSAYFRQEEEAKQKLQAVSHRWAAIEQEATTKMPATVV